LDSAIGGTAEVVDGVAEGGGGSNWRGNKGWTGGGGVKAVDFPVDYLGFGGGAGEDGVVVPFYAGRLLVVIMGGGKVMLRGLERW
jgi:hypothetical protein